METTAELKAGWLNSVHAAGDGGDGCKLLDDRSFCTAINYAVSVSLTFVRVDAFGALSRARQAEVLAAAAETERSQYDLLSTRTAENYARMRGNGVTITDPAPEPVLSAFKAAASVTIRLWKDKASPEAIAVFEAAGRR